MLNRLRERHRGEHDREAARRESNALDEIAVMRYAQEHGMSTQAIGAPRHPRGRARRRARVRQLQA